MADALTLRCHDEYRLTAAAAVASGEVWQLPTGEAAVFTSLNVAAANDKVNFTTEGQFTLTKASGFVALTGNRAYWDHSANAITYKKVNDRDFYVGRFSEDATSTATTCVVNLNVNPDYDIDALAGEGGYLSVATGTQALGGFLPPQVFGKSRALTLTATSEVQCVDILSVDKFAVGANAIAEFIFRLGVNGSTSAVDFSLGIANGTSASDADAITEHVLIHIDGGALDILAQSKDGTTTVTATDTTVDATAGSAVANRFEVWIDTRDPASVAIYINGSRVLSGTTFVLTAATGPLGLLAHLEKTTGTATAGPIYIDRMCCRFMEQ